MSGSAAEWKAPPSWASQEIVVPVLGKALEERRIRGYRGHPAAELLEELTSIFDAALQLRGRGLPIDFVPLAAEAGMGTAKLKTFLGKVEDWNWVIDAIRLRPTSHGLLPLQKSILVVKGEPVLRTGASFFGVASRSIPAAVVREMAERGIEVTNASANGTATESPAWLIEVSPEFSLVSRVEPLPQGTWFDPERYKPEARAIAGEALREAYGDYERSTRKIVGREVLGSWFESVRRHGRSANGVTVESGHLPHGLLGKEELFLGSRLDQALAIERAGARAFFDLARLSVRDPAARRRPEDRPWSGHLGIGEADCAFQVEGQEGIRQSWEMAHAASAALGLPNGAGAIEGIFRPADRRMVAEACENPSEVTYAVAQVRVKKSNSRGRHWCPVGLLVGSRAGMMPSGWSVPFADVRTPSSQREVIAMAEAHKARMSAQGPVRATMARLRDAGVQGSQAWERANVRALHGLILAADILDLRCRLFT